MDFYDRKARLSPALSVLAPVTLFVGVLFAGFQWWVGLIGLFATAGLHVLVIQLVRDRGSRIQSRLWKSWGGPPTTVKLRWNSARNLTLQRRRHEAVEGVTGIKLPSPEEEAADPDDADALYETAAGLLRELTRNGTEYPQVHRELANYGYRRNLYACRPHGVVVAVLVLVAELLWVVLGYEQILEAPTPMILVAAFCTVAWLAVWIFIVKPDFVRRDAERYAEALLSAAIALHR